MSLFGYWYCVSHEWLFPWFSLVWDWVHAQQGNTIQHMRERLPQLASAFLTNPIQDHHLIKNIQKIIKSTKLNHHSFLLDHHNIRLKVYLFIKKETFVVNELWKGLIFPIHNMVHMFVRMCVYYAVCTLYS